MNYLSSKGLQAAVRWLNVSSTDFDDLETALRQVLLDISAGPKADVSLRHSFYPSEGCALIGLGVIVRFTDYRVSQYLLR